MAGSQMSAQARKMRCAIRFMAKVSLKETPSFLPISPS